MLNIERILKQDRLVRATTGLNLKALKALEPSFKEAYQQSLIKPEKERKRQLGGGRKPTLRTILDKMVYILLYYENRGWERYEDLRLLCKEHHKKAHSK